MINWKQKLSSRKFWVAVIGFITPILMAFKVSENDITTIIAIITSGGTLIAYILAEGFIDKAREENGYFINEDTENGDN